jgi:hypothetical protein
MRRATTCSRWAMVATFSLLSADGLAAQGNPSPPPPVLQVEVESVRGGRGPAHAMLEQQWAQTFRQAGVPVYWLGATTETGPNEAWYFTGIEAIGDLEGMDKAVDASPGLGDASDLLREADQENVSSSRSFLARYREDLSRPGPDPVATGRYFEIETYRVRPGHESDFVEAAHLYQTVAKEANASVNWAVYQVVSGMPGPTFVVFTLMKSLSELDPGADAAALQRAFTNDRQKTMSQLASSGIISSTNLILRFQPRMSTLPKEFTDQDPAFWNVGR